MPIDVNEELRTLAAMTPTQLRQRYLQVIGEPTSSGNRLYLTRRILWAMQAQEEGSLSERARARAMELADDRQIRLTAPRPRSTDSARSGPVAVGRVEARQAPRLPLPGAVLTRDYKGRTICVTVLEKGFEMEGQHFTSLSAIAKAVTGTHWNGYHFFGIGRAKTGNKQ